MSQESLENGSSTSDSGAGAKTALEMEKLQVEIDTLRLQQQHAPQAHRSSMLKDNASILGIVAILVTASATLYATVRNNVSLQADKKLLQAQKISLDNEITQLTDAQSELRHQSDIAKRAHSDTLSQLRKTQGSLVEAIGQVALLTEQRTDLAAEIETLLGDRDFFLELLNSREQGQSDSDAASIADFIAHLQSTLSELRTRKSTLESELATSHGKLNAATERVKTLEARLFAMNTQSTSGITPAVIPTPSGQLNPAVVNPSTVPEVPPDVSFEKLSAAAEAYALAAAIDPSDFSAQFFHGLSLQLSGDSVAAIRPYLRALTIRPHDPTANLNLALAYLNVGEASHARVYAVRAIQFDSTSGLARFVLGQVEQALGKHEAAVVELQQAAELMPIGPELLLTMAFSLRHLDRFLEALNTLQFALLEPLTPLQSAFAYHEEAVCHFGLSRYEEAETSFRQSLKFNATITGPLNGLAIVLLNKYLYSNRTDAGALTEALALMRQSLQIDENQPRVAELLRRYQ